MPFRFFLLEKKKHKSHLFSNREQKLVVILGKRKCWSVVAEYRNVCVRVCVHCCVGLWHGGCNGSEQSVCWTRICTWLHLQRTGWLLLVVGVCALLWYLSIRLSVPSIYSSSNMQLVCCSLGTGVGYQSKAASASYWLLINVCCLCWSAAVSSQRYAVVQGMTVNACLLHLLAIKPLPCGNCFFIFTAGSGHNASLIQFSILALYILFACLYRMLPHLSFFFTFFLTHLPLTYLFLR